MVMHNVKRILAALLFAGALARASPQAEMDDRQRSILDRLQASIEVHEACVKLHNPGCLIYHGQPGARRATKGPYARFESMEAGRVALRRDLVAKLSRGMTVRRVMIAWNGGKYLAALLRETGLIPTDRW